MNVSQSQKLGEEWTYGTPVHGGRASSRSASPGPSVSMPGSHRTSAESLPLYSCAPSPALSGPTRIHKTNHHQIIDSLYLLHLIVWVLLRNFVDLRYRFNTRSIQQIGDGGFEDLEEGAQETTQNEVDRRVE